MKIADVLKWDAENPNNFAIITLADGVVKNGKICDVSEGNPRGRGIYGEDHFYLSQGDTSLPIPISYIISIEVSLY